MKCHPDYAGFSDGLPQWLLEHSKKFGFIVESEKHDTDLDLRARFVPRQDDWILEWDPGECLSIYKEGHRKLKWESSWLEPKLIHRLKTLGKQQPLAKAVGVKPDLSVWDLTAGWGRDTLALAWLGCQIQSVEESPVVGALLQAAHREALHDPTLSGAADRIQLSCQTALDFISSNSANAPQVIYLDPMYPAEDRTALPKKELQLLTELSRPSSEQEAELPRLLEESRKVAKSRVVVKRPPKAAPIGRPSHAVESKLVRYDVYVNSPK